MKHTGRHGERVRVRCSATGRAIGWNDLALVVSASDNDLFLDVIDTTRQAHPTLPVPSDRELMAAEVAFTYAARGREGKRG